MDATCTIQDSIHVFSLVHKYVSRILGTYQSGLVVAGVFHNSKKTTSGALESKAGWKGLCRKGMSLLFVLIAYRLDLAIGSNYIRDAVIIGFIVNETISIVENAGLMGVPLPKVINKAIDILTSKSEEKGGE